MERIPRVDLRQHPAIVGDALHGAAVLAARARQAIALRGYKRVFVALDNTDDADAKSREIALALRGTTYLPKLPTGVKDANERLVNGQATADDASPMLNRAKH